MKRRFTILTAALALLTFLAVPMGMWGQTRAEVVAYTLEPAAGSNTNYASNCDITIDGITWNLTGNSQMIPWRIGGKSLSNVDRTLYSKTAISDNISKIEVTHGTASSITVNSWTVIVASDASFNNVVSTLTPTFAASTTTTINRPTGADWSNCYFKFVYNVSVSVSSNKFIQFSEAKFYREEGAGTVIATPTFSPAGGEYTTAQNVTISCETQGASIYYTTNGSTPDNTSTQYTTAIPVSSTTTINAIAYVGSDASNVATATYNIVQPLATMQAIFDKATEVNTTATYVYITLDDWVVSGVSTNGKNVFVTDGTKGFVIFDNGGNMGFTAGDVLSGTVYCKVQLYNGFAELTQLNSTTSGLSITTGGTVTAANIAMANLAGVNTGALLHYDNLTCSESSGKYYLSDGTTTIQVYNSIYAFGALEDGEIYNITGIYQQYNSTKEILPRSANDIVKVEVQHNEYTLTVTPSANVEIYTFVSDDPTEEGHAGEFTAQVYDGTTVGISVSATAGYVLGSVVVDNVDVILQLDETGWYEFTMPTHAVTITTTAVIAPLYTVTLCDDNTTLTEQSYGAGVTLPTRNATGTYTFAGWSTTNVGVTETTTAPVEIIPAGLYHPATDIVLYPVYTRTEGGGSTATEWHLLNNLSEADAGVYALLTENYYAFDGTITSSTVGHGGATSGYFTFVDGVATSAPIGTLEITFVPVEEGGTVVGYKMLDPTTEKYLYASKNASGNLGWHVLENSYWSVHQSGNWYYPTSNGDAYLRSYSDNSFRTYGQNNGSLLKLAKKVEGSSSTTYYTSLLASYTLSITAYSGNKDHYYLIASPVQGDITPTAANGFITNEYDLYMFDQTADEDGNEWINFESNTFDLVNGTGYLYASSTATTLTFTGTPLVGPTASVSLVKDDDAEFPGWNLVGNPFAGPATIGRDFYIINDETNELMQNSGEIAMMNGVFVIAANNDEELTFTAVSGTGTAQASEYKLVLNLTKGCGLLDRAVVRFGEGRTLPKFQLNPNNTKLYITEGNQDFAVVRSNNAGEMPVSFKAAENGNYTLSIETENVEVSYLHLIDNMTGTDVDLMATPSYSFNARTTDNANRFRLMFNTNGVDENTTTANFAYFNGSSWTISNMGEATLQVVDMMGRVISTQAISGNTDVNLNQAAGVYMLRLVNGENVMVQKVVVR